MPRSWANARAEPPLVSHAATYSAHCRTLIRIPLNVDHQTTDVIRETRPLKQERLKLTQFGGQFDYATIALERDLNSNSIGLTYSRCECSRSKL